MGTIKKFGEFINEWVSSSTLDNYNDNDNSINNDGQREKNRERKTLIKNIWQEIKRNHLDKYLDFPEYDNLYDGGHFMDKEIKDITDSEKKQVYAYIEPDGNELSQSIYKFTNTPLDIFIYPNITIGGKHVDDIIINFNLLDENDENMENNFFIYNSVDDQISWETDTNLGHNLSWDDLNPNLEQIIKIFISILNPDSKYLS